MKLLNKRVLKLPCWHVTTVFPWQLNLSQIHKSSKEARAFLKSLGLLKKIRVIEGQEREQVLLMLKLVPYTDSDNQRLWTRSWQVGNISYEHITGDGFDELIEITEDDI